MDRLDRLDIDEKQPNDFVSNIDREAEAAIIDVLHHAYPDHGILGEESGQAYPEGEYNWVIDPLDGTLNYIQGIPHFSVSIAAKKGHNIEHGVIVDPVRNEEFTASRGKGAQYNGKRMRVSAIHSLEDAVFSTGIPPGEIKARLDEYMDTFKAFTGQCKGIRRLGSAALDLAYVAAGRLDGFWEMGLKPWDIAAGIVLVKEAGGFIGDLQGGENYYETGDIVAANPKLFKHMIQTIRPLLK